MAGQTGLEPATPGFGDRCSAKLSYWPNPALPRFLVRGVLPAGRAVLLELDPVRMQPLVLGLDVVAPLAVVAGQRDLVAHLSLPAAAAAQPPVYSRISVTTPAPTVRPPSRMAKRSSFSIAIGVISSTVMSTLSPGITISRPSGSVATPVTS